LNDLARHLSLPLFVHRAAIAIETLACQYRNAFTILALGGDKELKTGFSHSDASAAGFKFAIVVSRWNDAYTSRLEAGARRAFDEHGAVTERVVTFRVPGAFELPLVCRKAAKYHEFDAIVALGVVIRGDTPHFDYVAGETARGIMQVSLETNVPIMFGVITADNIEQTEARCGDGTDNKGYEAAVSAIEMANLMREMDVRREEIVGIPF
jgi:6,7-dimethyl-8-ribityllumazine synthase